MPSYTMQIGLTNALTGIAGDTVPLHMMFNFKDVLLGGARFSITLKAFQFAFQNISLRKSAAAVIVKFDITSSFKTIAFRRSLKLKISPRSFFLLSGPIS